MFRTWDDWCLLKLNELGKSTMQQWATAMGYENSYNLDKVIKNIRYKLKITSSATSRLKFYEVREARLLQVCQNS